MICIDTGCVFGYRLTAIENQEILLDSIFCSEDEEEDNIF